MRGIVLHPTGGKPKIFFVEEANLFSWARVSMASFLGGHKNLNSVTEKKFSFLVTILVRKQFLTLLKNYNI